MSPDTVIPHLLAQSRQRRQVSQHALARALGVSRVHLWRLETYRSHLSLALLLRCSQVLQIPCHVLVPALADALESRYAANEYEPTPPASA